MTSRLPVDKAAVSGAASKNPDRYRDKKKPKGTRPLGQPYKSMTDEERGYWEECREQMPWLNGSHRILLKLACRLAMRSDDLDCGIEAMRALSAVMSKLGATPVDETKVNHGSGDDEDPADEFFAGSGPH